MSDPYITTDAEGIVRFGGLSHGRGELREQYGRIWFAPSYMGDDEYFWTIVYDRTKRWWFVCEVKLDGFGPAWYFAGVSPYGGKNKAEAEASAKRIASKWGACYIDPKRVEDLREAVR